MKKYLIGIYYSLPVQLLLLHTKRYQILLIFWYILFTVVGGNLMRMFGADSLFLAPEYLNEVSPISTAIVGFSVAVFIMGWNITTFILHSQHITFLATTTKPFLKYCINNAVLPSVFLIHYVHHIIDYSVNKELLSVGNVLLLITGFMGGFVVSTLIAFTYFFGADKSIYRFLTPAMKAEMKKYLASTQESSPIVRSKYEIRVDWFLSTHLNLRKPRDVRHYSPSFINVIFKRHHFAAMLSIIIAFITLIAVGYFFDDRIFQIPAAASITLLFAILIAVLGAISYFLRNWGLILIIILYFSFNYLFQRGVIDFKNTAYGLNYDNINERPKYERESIMRICTPEQTERDKENFTHILNNWKNRQQSTKPYFLIINTSGGGTRSATFTMNVLQRLNAASHGAFMRKTFMFNGASGGMLGATYFRELYAKKMRGEHINLEDYKYVEDISKDLLNPIFSSFITRDLASPAKYFRVGKYSYIKDRAYAFEEKLNENTHYILNKSLGDYVIEEAEAKVPLIIFNSIITKDGRKLIISTQPMTFLMHAMCNNLTLNCPDADAIDFVSLFKLQDPYNLRLLTALRMNATFPYILPNVWLPTNPVIDVMDAGLRDNFGQEMSLRFLQAFKEWIKENTNGVILIQIRDRPISEWEKTSTTSGFFQPLLTPFFILQKNWHKLQSYVGNNELSYWQDFMGPMFHRFTFEYIPQKDDAHASLSFHLTPSEKQDIKATMESPHNTKTLEQLAPFLQ